jgi:hypothetical protein
MRKRLLLILAVAALMLPVAAANVKLDLIRDLRDIDRARYDVMFENTFEGSVASTGHVVEGLLYFPLKTADRVIEVQLGPKDFVERSGFKLKIDEIVTVIGVPRMVGALEMLLAREVRTAKTILVLRDRNGRPTWDSEAPVPMDPEFDESTMCEMVKP